VRARNRAAIATGAARVAGDLLRAALALEHASLRRTGRHLRLPRARRLGDPSRRGRRLRLRLGRRLRFRSRLRLGGRLRRLRRTQALRVPGVRDDTAAPCIAARRPCPSHATTLAPHRGARAKFGSWCRGRRWRRPDGHWRGWRCWRWRSGDDVNVDARHENLVSVLANPQPPERGRSCGYAC
jgi:hypothetical protein